MNIPLFYAITKELSISIMWK